MVRKLAALILGAGLFLVTGCAPRLLQGEIGDLERMPQTPLAYLDPATAHRPLLSPGEQERRAVDFLERYFAPWHTAAPLASTRSPFWAVDWVAEQTVFAENLRPAGRDRLRALIAQAAPDAYPSLNSRAITVRRSNLRALPSSSPLFLDPGVAGEGFPFDHLQHAALPANTPLHVSHRSADGGWVFAETDLAYGWMPEADLAWVDEEFVRTFATGNYLAPTRDQVPVVDTGGLYRFSVGVGTLLPLTGTGSAGHHVLIAVADKDRRALLVEAVIPHDRGELFPLPLTPERLATLAGNFMGQAYDWGGSFDGRDCSATVRDLFAPFGLWLPRNSAEQALAGTVMPLSELSPGQRESRLLADGIPFLTLVRVPGHIMLYLGQYEGRAALLHTLWGLRTRNLWGREGRWIVGKTVITTLEPGLERDSLTLEVNNLRQRIESMNLLRSAERAP